MPLPSVPTELPAEACAALAQAINPRIVLPGGVVMQAVSGLETGDPMKIVRGTLAGVSPAIAPLTPVFDLIEALVAVKELGEAIPNPVKITEALQKLTKKVTGLVAMLPQLTVPNLAKSVVETIAAGLRALRGQLAAMIAHGERIAADEVRAQTLREPARTALLSVVGCARENLGVQLANENAAMGPLNRLIATLNALLSAVGLPCIPVLGDVELDPGVLDLLDDVAEMLEALGAAIPGAGFELPGLPAPGDC